MAAILRRLATILQERTGRSRDVRKREYRQPSGLRIEPLEDRQMLTGDFMDGISLGDVPLPPINEAGIFHPLYAMPPDARMQSLLWPATHYVVIARGIFLKGVGVGTFIFDGLFLLGAGLLLNSLAVWRLKKKLA